ncbi:MULTISPECIES: hypothetical protein [Geobacillus]|nr:MULTISPECIES: hypothetical protein [Geobacillus]
MRAADPSPANGMLPSRVSSASETGSVAARWRTESSDTANAERTLALRR